MANDTLPMNDFFQTCYNILVEKLRPLHYVTLTELALNQLGLKKSDVNWARQIEDVREKMLLPGRYQTFYTGKPDCLVGLKWWFEDLQLRLAHPTSGVWIAGSAQAGSDGAFEALMRDPYMKIKTQAPLENIYKARATGLVLEEHMRSWFRTNWPELYLPSDNENNWSAPCDHDWKLLVYNKTYLVDVSGKKLNGKFGNPGKGKKRVSFHLLGQIVDKDVLWHTVYPGRYYDKELFPDTSGICPERMIVWLNCAQQGLDYNQIKMKLLGLANS